MWNAILMFGEPGVEIMYPNPGFPIYESVIKYSGATAVPIPMLEESVSSIFWTYWLYVVIHVVYLFFSSTNILKINLLASLNTVKKIPLQEKNTDTPFLTNYLFIYLLSHHINKNYIPCVCVTYI